MATNGNPSIAELASASWFTSTYSGGQGLECVEIAFLSSLTTAVRDSKDPGGPVLGFSQGAWRDFVVAVRREQMG
ncbi:DUF397 domain-containing protein [Streptomyces sp. NPDC005393]|uniref:DUF397 domain-containing protein n=1 Tax=Streptomyces sp. NPDC005393 TaxID=3157041 RepID=UPI0033A1A890